MPGMKNQVIVLAGATAVGKSKVAQLLCRHLGNAEVVVADSVQVYKHLDIGSNKPSAQEQAEIPHHCISLVEPGETYSGGDFVREAVTAIFGILNRGNVPVVVGGSTMWIQWLVEGIPDAPKADPEVLAEAETLLHAATHAQDWDAALAVLRTHAPDRADKIGANDWYRCRRYLEVALATRNLAAAGVDPAPKRTLALPGLDVRCFFMSEERDELYRTIDMRCEDMVQMGLLKEVASLVLRDQLAPDSVAAKAIGYRQTLEFFCLPRTEQNSRTFKEYLNSFATATRNYAKRQLHWYRKDKAFLWMQVQWRQGDGQGNAPYSRMLRELCHWKDIDRDKYVRMVKHQVRRAEAAGKMRQLVKLNPKGFQRGKLSDFDWLAVAAMVAAGEIEAPRGQAVMSQREEQIFWSTSFSVPRGSGLPAPGSRSAVQEVDSFALADEASFNEMMDEDDAYEQLSLQGTRGSVPRTLPEFPNPPLPPSEWTAEDILIRAAEVNGGKGQRTPMANKLREYFFDSDSAAYRCDGELREARELAAQLREQFPDLLDLYFPDRDRGARPRSRSRSPSPPAGPKAT